MNSHKRAAQIFLLLILVFKSAEISFPKDLTPGRRGIIVDERLAALRRTPHLNGPLVRRLGRGRKLTIRGSKTTPDGVVFLLVNVTTRTHGWVQSEAVASPSNSGDDRRLLDLIKASHGFDQIVRARIFLDHFPRSPLRPKVLLLLGNTAQSEATKLTRDAAKRLNNTLGPEFTYFLNYSGLDRYNRQRVTFIFHRPTKRFHYDGAAWREVIRRYPNSPEALEARRHLAELAHLQAKTQISLLPTAYIVCCVAMRLRPVNLKKVSDIGVTHVAVRVRSPSSKELYTADFLIDTGALHSVAPASELTRIGIQPHGTRTFELAGGQLVEYQFGAVELSFLGKLVVTDILFGTDHTEPTLGRLALLSAGYFTDPRN